MGDRAGSGGVGLGQDRYFRHFQQMYSTDEFIHELQVICLRTVAEFTGARRVLTLRQVPAFMDESARSCT